MKISLHDVELNVEETGPSDGPALVLIHEFGSDLSIWDSCLALLPKSVRIVRFDLRGHGNSNCPPAPYSMGSLIRDAENLLTNLDINDSVVLGIGLGGLIAQGLAVKRLDQVRALILCNSAAKIGHVTHWQAMIQEIEDKGTQELAARLMPLWFNKADVRNEQHLPYQRVFEETPAEGLTGVLHALKGSDFYTPTSGLRLPTLGISGTEDRMVPSDMTRETTGLVPGSEFKIIRKSAHLPPVDQPEAFAACVSEFLKDIGHI